jgi:ribonuclease HII
MKIPDNRIEKSYWEKQQLIAGIDEVGRGALAGPVVASAVIFPPNIENDFGCTDSKALSAAARATIAQEISKRALCIMYGVIDNHEIDAINIRNATLKAMQIALNGLCPVPHHAFIDGNFFQHDAIPFTTIIKGDAHCFSIAAASIMAKVYRDEYMQHLAQTVPTNYYFAENKGYGTAAHREIIARLGPCSYHRKTFLNRIVQYELPFQEYQSNKPAGKHRRNQKSVDF